MNADALNADSRADAGRPATGARNWRVGDTLGVYGREAAHEFWMMLRMPGFALPMLLFPTMFYLFFGTVFGDGQYGAHFLAAYGTFGVMGPGLFGFGVGVAMQREHGVFALKRVFPLPTGAYFFSRFVMSALFALIITAMLSILAATLSGVALARADWFMLAAVLVLGTIPFCALGLAVGLYVNGQAAAAVVNLIYLPMAFLSGLWVPLQLLPNFLQQFALALPAYHLNQLARAAVGETSGGNAWIHVGYLAGCTLIFVALAVRGWRRIQDR